MMWFNKLPRRVRNIIAGVSWGLVAVATGIVGAIYGGNTENAHPAVAVIVVAFVAVAVVFTVFAAKATSRERAAAHKEQDDKKAAQAAARRASYFDVPAERINEQLVRLDNEIRQAQEYADALSDTDTRKKDALQNALVLTNIKKDLLRHAMSLMERGQFPPQTVPYDVAHGDDVGTDIDDGSDEQ